MPMSFRRNKFAGAVKNSIILSSLAYTQTSQNDKIMHLALKKRDKKCDSYQYFEGFMISQFFGIHASPLNALKSINNS